MTEENKIDLNRADEETLAQLTGIGENLAQRIIVYRETVHPFEEVIELAAVPGISERLVRTFADQVTVEGQPEIEPEDLVEDEHVSEPELEDVERTAADEDWTESFFEESMIEEETAEASETTEPIIEEAIEEDTMDEVVVASETAESVVEEMIEEEAVVEEEEVVAAEETAVAEEDAVVEDDVAEAETPTEEEPTEEPEPEPVPVVFERTPEPPPISPPAPPVKQKRPLGLILLGSLLGAFVGVILTLAILAGLNNGTLQFAQADTRLRGQIESAQQAQDDLSQSLADANAELGADLETVTSQADTLAQQQQEIEQSIAAMGAALEKTDENVAALEALSEELDERLTSVAAAAETFDAFLDGLRNLLVDLQGMPVPTMTPYATPEKETTTTPVPETPNADDTNETAVTATPEESNTARSTRTPRPSATPIPLPTSTPGQQP